MKPLQHLNIEIPQIVPQHGGQLSPAVTPSFHLNSPISKIKILSIKNPSTDSLDLQGSGNLRLNLPVLHVEKIHRQHRESQEQPNRTICIDPDASPLVFQVACLQLGWKAVSIHEHATKHWDIFWKNKDFKTPIEVGTSQKANHFRGMSRQSNSSTLFKILKNLNLSFKNNYSYFPKTWTFPMEEDAIQEHLTNNKSGYLIFKPNKSGEKDGALLVKTWEDVQKIYEQTYNQNQWIVQAFIQNSLKIHNFPLKFKFYVLMTSCQPLTLFMHSEGFVIIGDSSQTDFAPMTFTAAMQVLDPHDTFREMLLFKVNDIVIKTMLCMNSNLRKKYKLVHHADLFGDKCF